MSVLAIEYEGDPCFSAAPWARLSLYDDNDDEVFGSFAMNIIYFPRDSSFESDTRMTSEIIYTEWRP